MDRVKIIRRLRDGSITIEVMPRWLAELVAAEVPYTEPLTASLRIVALSDETQPTMDRQQSAQGVALAIYYASLWQTGVVQ